MTETPWCFLFWSLWLRMWGKVSGNDFCYQNYLKVDFVSRFFSSQYVTLFSIRYPVLSPWIWSCLDRLKEKLLKMGSFQLYLNFWGIILLELPWKYYAGSLPNGPQRLFLSSLAFLVATCGYRWSDRNSNHSNFPCLWSHLMVPGHGFPVPSNILPSISRSPQRGSWMCSQSHSSHPIRQCCEPLLTTVPWQILCCPVGHHVWYGVVWGTFPTSLGSAGSTDIPDTLSLSISLGGFCWVLVSLSEALEFLNLWDVWF